MLQRFKSKIVMVTLAGTALMLLSAFGNWFYINNELAVSLVAEEYASMRITGAMIGILAFVLAGIEATTGQRAVAGLGVLLGVYAMIFVGNQLPGTSEAELLGTSTALYFWFAVIGSALIALGNAGILFHGFASSTQKPDSQELTARSEDEA